MNYCLYKLDFKTAIHIGKDSGGSNLDSSEATIHADTLFSALCIEALKAGGQKLLDELYLFAKNDQLKWSDLFPFIGEEYYLPKPIISIDRPEYSGGTQDRKDFKKLKYIPASGLKDYINHLKGTGSFDAAAVNKAIAEMGSPQARACAAVSGREVSLPYYVGTYTFRTYQSQNKEKCGLYLITGFLCDEARNLFEALLQNLSHSGIGGKRTAGLGKFELDDVIYLDEPYCDSQAVLKKLLNQEGASVKMALNVCLPQDDELDAAVESCSYLLIRRGGFVQSSTYAENPLKKRVLYAFGPGSCFQKAFRGDIFDVSYHGSHPVYRYLKPLFGGLVI